MNSEPDYPDFVVLCDHGIQGGPPDLVDRFRWIDSQGVWSPELGLGTTTTTYLEGDQPGWFHRDSVQSDGTYKSRGPSRVHREISCPNRGNGCTRQPLRIPDEHLQELLAILSADKLLAATKADNEIQVTVDQLHAARRLYAAFVGRS